jgi:ribosomal-protein-alanine N-acetyltransferase
MGGKTSVVIRRAGPDDLPRIAAIQAASPEASRWEPAGYLSYECLVAVLVGRVVGFVAWRELGADEAEILNLAVDPGLRRRGIGSTLLRQAFSLPGQTKPSAPPVSSTELPTLRGLTPKIIHLEVRASNQAARSLYRSLCFLETGIRQRYYDNPSEDGIVMTLQSC